MKEVLMLEVKEQLKSLKPYEPGKPIEQVKEQFGLTKVIKLASNENPYGCSDKVKQAIQEELESLAIYPDGYSAELRKQVAKHVGVKENQLIFGNGSDNIIQILSRSLLSEGFNTVMASPSFSQYRHNAVIENAEIREIELVDGRHNLDKMADSIDSKTKIVWLCNPNNPTGVYISEEELINFLNKVPKDVLVVSDEAYYEYVTAEDYPNSVALLDQFPNLLILRTFSKAYGLAALRVGYGIGYEELIRLIEPAREPFNTNRLGQKAAIAALNDQTFIETCKKLNREGLKQYYDFCEQFGLEYFPSQTNFILIDFQRDADELFQQLLEKGFIVRSGKALGFPTSLRITVGTEEENEALIQTLKELLS